MNLNCSHLVNKKQACKTGLMRELNVKAIIAKLAVMATMALKVLMALNTLMVLMTLLAFIAIVTLMILKWL